MSGAGTTRTPGLQVLVNGEAIPGACEAEIFSNNHFAADRFTVVLALDADAAADATFWSSTSNILVEIRASVDNALNCTSLITGYADIVSVDAHLGVVHMNGRDFTAALLESPTQETFANRTSSEVATILAQRHGLIPRVVSTNTPVGRFYESDHELLTLSRFSTATTEWDLLIDLARRENFDAFVEGNSLFFQPVANLATIDRTLCPSELREFRMSRSLILARDIQITVQSWNSQQQAAYSERITSIVSQGRLGDESRGRLRYVVTRPNLTPDKATTLAQQKLAEVSRHERTIEFVMPGELTLTARSTIALQGTGGDFDQTYYVDSVERTIRPRTGFTQRVRASNSSPRNTSIAVPASPIDG